jgi:hypothetical protein
MTRETLKIWDNLNNCELTFDYPDIPETIKHVIEETISKNALQCLDPVKAKGNCLRISDQLMMNLYEVGKKPFVDCKIIFAKKPHPHFWILVDDWHIDLTARQFNPKEPCPKIWKHQEADSNSFYSVEKGKGLVLFQLVPLNASPKPVNIFKSLFHLLKNRGKKVVTSLTIHENFENNNKIKKYLKIDFKNARS